jgi:hypothetical protein
MTSMLAFIWALLIRLLKVSKEILVLLDQAVCLAIMIPIYLMALGPPPRADQTISSIVGYYSIKGRAWAHVLEWFIDRLFYVFEGFKLGHCRKRIEWEDIDWEDVSNHP